MAGKASTPNIIKYVDQSGLEKIGADPDTLVRFASEALRFGEHSFFEVLPAALDRIIELQAWKQRDPPLRDFGQLALQPTGLGIRSDRGLALLRSAMDVKGRHLEAWSQVLDEVEKAVKSVVTESGKTLAYIRTHAEEFPNVLTYSPSSASFDHRLLDLRRTDKVTFKQVASGKKPVSEAIKRKTPNANYVTRLKSAWKGASEEEKRMFRNWLKKPD